MFINLWLRTKESKNVSVWTQKDQSVVIDNNYQLKSLNYLANTLLIEQEGLFANVHYNQSPIGEKSY